ncbi:MAG: hypothetical protein H0V70_27330 [Ktedonobacteraceae bacterium]|nr:hypothetical protein [Ktedonobacteraceae bacterium]
MITIPTAQSVQLSLTLIQASLPATTRLVVPIALWLAGFLCLLNIALAIFFRRNPPLEIVSYVLVVGIELVIFILALMANIGTLSRLPFYLPPSLPINQAEIVAALAIGIGLFPAAYWHRINVSELPKRIAEDGKTMKDREDSVHVRTGKPSEWMN